MHRIGFASTLGFASSLILTFATTSCSDDASTGAPVSQANPNQPSGNAGAAGRGTPGTGGGATASTAGSGGSAAETPDENIDLDDPPSVDDESGSGVVDASAPPAEGDAGSVNDTTMSFFVTSVGGPDGANFGGLAGADAICTSLAAAVSPELGAKTWAAYLSTTGVDARDRIGDGPWFNAAGVLVATDVEQLTDPAALEATWASGDATIALDEQGDQVPSGGGGPQQHDILTGTLADGTVATGLTCADWTATTGNVEVGHSNRAGGGQAPSSWSSAHGGPAGCAPPGAAGPNVTSGGGRGSIYCFEVN